MKLQYRGSGKVFYKEKEYKCDLYYNEKLGGVLININHMIQLGSLMELPVEINTLSGELENGFKFILYKSVRTKTNTLISYGKTVYTYEAENLFCGVGGKECNGILFYKVEYTLSDIVEWGEVASFKVGEKYELIKTESGEKILYEGDEDRVTYKVYGSSLPVVESQLLTESIEIRQQGVIEIQTQRQQNIEYFNSLFQKIKRLIEISSLRKINLEKMEVYSKEIYDLYGEHKIDRAITVYGIMITEYEQEKNKSPIRRFSWITLPELMKYNCVANYFDKYELLEPIIELYLETLYSRSSSRRVFLNVVQALETYHSRFVTNDLQIYVQRVERLVNKNSEEIAQKDRAFLMANSKKFITLESRLADLLFAENQRCFDTGDIGERDFPEIVAKTRNYYIHYDERIKNNSRVLTTEELEIYNSVLFLVLEYYILKELGYPAIGSGLGKKLTERWGSVSQRLDIIRMSREIEQSN